MINVTLLGCGGTMPLPNRWLTSLYIRCNGHGILIDCGEGTQIAMKQAGLSPHDVDIILLTHFHGDHVMGLPGILMSMGMNGRIDPVTIVGPRNLNEVVSGLCVCAGIPFTLQGIELTDAQYEIEYPFNPLLHIKAFSAQHSVPTYGYSVELNRLPRFDAARARKLNIPIRFWGRLQKGEAIHESIYHYTPDMVLGEERKGLKIVYCTDTRPTPAIGEACKDADLLVLEGMYGEDERLEAAKVKKHMIFREAAEIAKYAKAKELWLTHFSPSESHPEQWIKYATNTFPNAKVGTCGMTKELNYKE